ncbi:MAG: PepSY-associated TM helix domain-containing protein [Steroidobacteraceae bacterium]
MKEGFRQCMAWLHTWSGLVVGWVLFFVFVTGTVGYFSPEITRWMQPELPLQQAVVVPQAQQALDVALGRLQRNAPGAEFWSITLPHQSLDARGWQDLAVAWETLPQEGHEHGVYHSETLDVVTGEQLRRPEPRKTFGGSLLYRMHYSLHYVPYEVAIRIVGVCTMLMLLAIVTGVITHKKIFRDFFTFRPRKGQRSWLDAHNVISVMALPFFLMITYSGLVFFTTEYMPGALAAVYGADDRAIDRYYDDLYPEEGRHLAVARPAASVADMVARAEAEWGAGEAVYVTVEHHEGEPAAVVVGRQRHGQVLHYENPTLRFDALTGARLPDAPPPGAVLATSDTLFALHEGRFAGTGLRWLYFVSGLLGCAMIGTGLVLWTVKRRKQHESLGGDAHFGLRLVEALNVATIAGLPVAVAAYFWANRLLPLDMADRAEWEAHWMFIVWGEILLYAFLRDTRRAWVEVSWLAAAAYALLPVVNLLTTDRHLGVTLPAGDWVLAGFDLTVLALAGVFAVMALRIQRHWFGSRLPGQVPAPSTPTAEAGQ